MISVQYKTGETRDALKGILADLISGLPRAMTDVVADVSEHARQNPEHYRPRHGMQGLQGATKGRLLFARGDSVRGEVRNNRPYAMAIHDGSKPHPIVAKRAPYLVFFWAKVGHWMRIKTVNHPGTKPRPFLQTSRNYGVARLTIRMMDLVGEIIRRHSK